MSQLPQGRYVFTFRTLEEALVQLNVLAERLQVGGMVQAGVKLALRDTVPTVAPAAGTPNLVGVVGGGVVRLYVHDGATWQVAGTQS